MRNMICRFSDRYEGMVFKMEKIRIAICDDVEQVCEGYRMYIEREQDMEYAGSANSSKKCLELVKSKKPDILLLDIYIEDEMTGINMLSSLKEIAPEMSIIMLTSYNDSQYIFHSIMNGADGYIVKKIGENKIIDQIREIYGKKTVDKSDEVMDAFKAEVRNLYKNRQSMLYMINQLVKLSPSEYEILRDIYNGMTYKKIAQNRFVEECTIKSHASRILKKFDADSMKSLIKDMRELKIFENF